MSRIGVGIVGLGALGAGQARMAGEIEGVSVVKGADVSAAAREKARDGLGVETFEDWARLVADPDLHLVLVSTPNHLHIKPALAALRAGKAVLLQKPMAVGPQDCEEILRVAEETGAFLQVGFECRYSLLYARVREIVEAGELGEVRDVGISYSPGLWPIWLEHAGGWKYRRETSGGMVLEKLSHYLDLVRWYVGRPVREVRTVTPGNVVPFFEIVDNMRVFTVFEGGSTGCVRFSFTRSPAASDDSFAAAGGARSSSDLFDLEVLGTEGSLSFNKSFLGLDLVRYRREGGFEPFLERTEDYSGTALDRLLHDNATELADVVRRVAGGRGPGTDPRDSLETMRVCFAAEESARSGKSVFLQ